jgi:2,4-dienoyl-CoA reductase-like NADH-dependent reductase (Old Yellow Enzyme family)
MPGPALFEPRMIAGLELANRIVIEPMCQFMAVDGCMTDWHLIHLGHLAYSGAALLTVEATAVLPEARITYADVGLWDDATETAMARTIESVRRHANMPIAIQLAHAGRKASCEIPWRGSRQIPPGEPNGWQAVAPTAAPYTPGSHPPVALNADGIAQVRDAFVAAALRSARIGYDAVQIHAAHGYLLHQFLSPLSNQRDDDYGGSLENRMRFPLEVFDAVRAALPADIPVTVRVSATDWVAGGWDIAQTIAFASALEARGCAAIDVSSGALDPRQDIPVGPNYQVALARAVKQAVVMPVIAVGLITDATQAEAIVGTGDADFVGLARAMLYDPRWPWHAAAQLGARVAAPAPYLRSQPRQYSQLFDTPSGAVPPSSQPNRLDPRRNPW